MRTLCWESEFTTLTTAGTYSLDEKKAQIVVDEIKAAGGEAIAVGGDVGAEDFPERIVKATVECVNCNFSHVFKYLREL